MQDLSDLPAELIAQLSQSLKGERHSRAPALASAVALVRSGKLTQTEAARMLGCSRQNVHSALKRPAHG